MLVKLPDLNFDAKDAGKYLVKFYKKLGWDGKLELDVTEVIVSREDWETICKKMMDFYPPHEKSIGGLLCMNSGPSASASIPKGKVKIPEVMEVEETC